MNSTRFQVLRPSELTINPEIKTIVLVNRYKPSKQNTWLNAIEGIFSGEFLFTDRRGAESALIGLKDALLNSPRYNIVMANEYLEGSGIGFFPDPLQTNRINELCRKYNADALLSIEAFDSDVALMSNMLNRRRTIRNKQVLETYFRATERIRLTIGWRLYQSGNGALIDQQQLYNQMEFNAEAPTEMQARMNLLNPDQAIQRTAAAGGQIYANRIAPRWTFVTRSYYKRAKGTERMKEAARFAVRNQWDKAIELWQQLTRSADPKIAGRACYNLAVASEVKGSPNIAIDWAKKAGYTYNIPAGRSYVSILQRRLNEIERLDVQMDNRENR